MTSTALPTRTKVIDCPAYAWDGSDQPAIVDLRQRFGEQWVSDFREDLDLAAYDLVRDQLLVAWRDRGYEPEFTDDKAKFEADSYTPAPTDPPNATYWAVWDAAAYAIDADRLIDKANLRDYAR
jgi:hypothetical protein